MVIHTVAFMILIGNSLDSITSKTCVIKCLNLLKCARIKDPVYEPTGYKLQKPCGTSQISGLFFPPQ